MSLYLVHVSSVGNHELYVYENALDTFINFVPQQRGRYLASNVNITHTLSDGSNVTEPMGKRFVKFRTEHGRKVTSLGVLYNFQGQAQNLTVQPPVEMIKEQWFLDAIQERPDFFLLVGHMPVRNDDWPAVVSAIRAVHSDVPLVVTGGHTHIRDCYIYDDHAFGIESGRYLETIGWLAFNISDKASNANSTATSFSRTYIDANRRNYAIHAGLSSPSKLPTSKGRKITKEMNKVAKSWNLTQVFGTNPQDYYLDRVPASSPSSLLYLLTQKVLPTVISTSNPNRSSIPNIVIANSGSQRFDVYQGPFTKNDQYIVSPFIDKFLYLKDVPFKYATGIVNGLNSHPTELTKRFYEDDSKVHVIYSASKKQSALMTTVANATLGYVTKDSCPGLGDDTEVSERVTVEEKEGKK
jgi:2',3'-cyclic-nucleotide 2'-phosphodiesterase (5'-nucleotidase family)